MYDNIASHDSHGRYSRRRLQRCRRWFATGYSTAARLAASLCRRRRAMGYRFAKKLWESLTGCGISGSEHILKRLVPNQSRSCQMKLHQIIPPGPSKVPKKLSCWNFERKSAQTVRKSCKHARLAHLDQTFRNQVAQELLVVI